MWSVIRRLSNRAQTPARHRDWYRAQHTTPARVVRHQKRAHHDALTPARIRRVRTGSDSTPSATLAAPGTAVYSVYMPAATDTLSTDSAAAILSAASRILRTEGAAAVSMRRVGDDVGITAMAIYRHFPNRDALIGRIADDGFAALAARAAKVARPDRPPRERLRALLTGYLDFALAEPHWYDCMFADQRAGARQFPDDFARGQSPTASLVARALEDGMADGTFARDDVWSVALMLSATAHGLISLHRGGRVAGDIAAFRRRYRDTMNRVLHGLDR